MFDNCFRGKKIVVTGCFGYKGSWLCRWLRNQGAIVYGFGHPPSTSPSHANILSLSGGYLELLGYDDLLKRFHDIKPDLVIHLAAKAIVADCFKDPRHTFENNLMAAVNIMEAARQTESVKGVVLVTTDKVYEDQNWMWGYRENDELGGIDPYSASKVCIEHATRCYRGLGVNIAACRAGNVIGGGDWSPHRLLPDMVKAASNGEPVVIHTPQATRPFQHILDALRGYLLLGQKILNGEDVNEAWNFGPSEALTVLEVLKIAKNNWDKIGWTIDEQPTHDHMVYQLKLDSSKALNSLGWKTLWSTEKAIAKTIEWYRAYFQEGEVLTDKQIEEYEGKE